MLLRLQEEFAGARPLFERALRIDDETFGSDSGASGYALARLGDLSHAEGVLDTAQAQLDRALTLISRHYGADHPEMATVLTYSGRLLLSQRAPRQALSVFERALRLGEQIYGEHPRVAEVLVDLARTRLALNEPAAAESLLRRALAIQRRTLPARHPSFVATLTLLGQGEHAAPDRPERLKLLEEAVDTARHALAPSHSARRTAEEALRRAQPASVPQPASVR
jgi:tetratricopeptide (TPR) repeat protein